MRIFSENIFEGSLKPSFSGYIEFDDLGKIQRVFKSNYLNDSIKTDGYYKAVCPGFVNAHCHIELSHLKGKIAQHTLLSGFIKEISTKRNDEIEVIKKAIKEQIEKMYHSGISAVVDICNTNHSFELKSTYNGIHFINMIELFGLNPNQKDEILNKGLQLKNESINFQFETYLTPHASYSLSEELFLDINDLKERFQSLHFNETQSEFDFFNNHEGKLFDLMEKFKGSNPLKYKYLNPANAIIPFFDANSVLALVHNTFSTKEEIELLSRSFKQLFFVICPNANLYIENTLPDFELFKNFKNQLSIGTDSLASNNQLSIWEEIVAIFRNSKVFKLNELIAFACHNGAKMIGKDDRLGLIKEGYQPGIVEIDLQFNNPSKRLI